MKTKILLFVLVAGFTLGCSNLDDLNIDKKNPASVPGASLFTSAQKNLVDQMVKTNVNYNIFRLIAQQWTETTYTDEANYDLGNRAIPEQHWDELYRRTLRNLKEAATVIADEDAVTDEQVANQKNRLAIIEALSVYAYSVLVETFGDVPYTEALNIDNLLPKYDDQQTIYMDLMSRLNAAINNMDPNYDSFDASADNVYQGNVAGWMAFANTLKLRMAMTIADVNASASQSAAEAAAPGVIASNAMNSTMEYLSSTPNTNPLYVDLVASGRQDFIAANTLVDAMNALQDPRRALYFDDNKDDPNTPEVEYVGGIYGNNSAYADYTHVNPVLGDPTFPGTIMSYAEAEFLLAEAAARGYNVGGTAESHYNAAITASIMEWGGTQAMADDYLANPDVAYATAQGDWKQKIGMQEWIGLYNRGFEAWDAWRRLDVPTLEPPVPPAAPRSDVPLRFTYPIVEQTLNPAQYDAAAAAIGGDLVSTKLFWDIN